MALARTVLVGHVQGRSFSADRLKLWVKEIWGTLFTEFPDVQELPRGWFSLHFVKEDHTNNVLAQYWHIEMAPVLLKRWSPLFDPEREQIGAGPLWVQLSGLPLQYWNEEAFVKIGNALGTYLDHDRSYKETNKRILARILVHLDTREGLEAKMTLRWGKFSRSQILDYEGVPFRCNRCHQAGHLFKDCPLNTTQEGSPKPSPVVSSGAPQNTSHSPQSSAGPGGELAKLDKRKIAPPSPPLTRT